MEGKMLQAPLPASSSKDVEKTEKPFLLLGFSNETLNSRTQLPSKGPGESEKFPGQEHTEERTLSGRF